MVRYSSTRPTGYGTRHDDGPPVTAHRGPVLIIDPDPRTTGVPGPAARAAWTLAQRLGFDATVVAGHPEDQPIDLDGGPVPELVVLVIGAEPTGGHPTWSTSTWCVPAQLAGIYVALGIDVLAVSSGATAGALAGCVEQGASVLFDCNELAEELITLGRSDVRTGRWTPDQDRHDPRSPLHALQRLTSSERRVLYYLTTGLAAQEIAEELVVSLATVRSHIRSILRKFEVRSQLAAVAVANSCGTVRMETSHAS